MSGQPPPPGMGTSGGLPETRLRFFSQEYADIQKLRERAQKNAHIAMKLRHKASKYMTSMERYKHKATIMREKSALVTGKIPVFQEQMKELQDELKVGAQAVGTGGVRPRDQSKIHLRIRKLQEKVVKYQRKAAYYDSKASHYMAISSVKKVNADIHEEKAKAYDIEAHNDNMRADRLQQATEADVSEAGTHKIETGRA